jgi:glucose/arabinose dehydrogenase
VALSRHRCARAVVAAVCVAAVVVTAAPAHAAPSLSGAPLVITAFASGLDTPVAIATRKNDARLYVAEKGGAIRIVNTNGSVVSTPVLSIAVATDSEQGLIGLAFSPGGTKLYVDYANPGNGDIRVVEYTMNGDVANVGTRRELISIPHPTFDNHYGGDIRFGPDGKLYISTGDGGSGGDPPNNAQNLNSLLGKILRIDVTPDSPLEYTIPADNPFVGKPGRDEIWMYGLRNPWRWSFDKLTGDMWIGDVGQNAFEEIDYAPAGEKGINWGWRNREGFHAYNGGTPPAGSRNPLLETNHNDSSCAIIGGYVYRGSKIPNLNGAYLFGDLCRAMIVGVAQSGGKVVQRRDMSVEVGGLTAFGQDNSGELYAATLSGTIYKLGAGTTLPAGYYQAAFDGRVFGFHGALPCTGGSRPSRVVGIAGNTFGYWTVTQSGAITACRVKGLGSMSHVRLNKPIVGLAATPNSDGYWMVASDGGIFTFGGARYFGSTGNRRLNKPIVGMAPTPSGRGYWLVASDGGIFAFGDARYFGSTGAMRLNKPIVGMAATLAGDGYWLVASDGGIFTFGKALFYGSTGGRSIPAAISGMSASPGGKGYWFTGRTGVVYGFGDAKHWGNASNRAATITGIAHD